VVGEVLNGAQAGSVEGGHVAKPKDDDRCEVGGMRRFRRELVGGAEQERSVIVVAVTRRMNMSAAMITKPVAIAQ